MARIALFLPRFSRYGGAEGFGLRLATALAEQGHEVTFVCSRQEHPAPPDLTVRCVGRRGVTRAGKMLWFARQCERLRPEFDLTIGLGKTWRQDILRIGGGPLRGFWRLSDTAWPAGPSRLWKQLRRRLSPANRLALLLERAQLRNARRVIAVSDMVGSLLLEQHPFLDARKLTVIYNEPDSRRFSPTPPQDAAPLREILGLPPKNSAKSPAILTGFAGSNFRLKGLDPLLRAMALLPQHVHLAVAGGRNPYKYAALARRLDISQRVHFLGKVENMPGFYHALDVFALPSHYDACANAVLEAMSCGIPTVSTTANGSSLVLPPSWTVAHPVAPDPLAHAIMTAAASREPARLAWPTGAQRGLGPWLQLIEQQLLKKRSCASS